MTLADKIRLVSRGDPELVVCKDCDGTGMKDRVRRCFFAPGTCPPCSGTGWVNPKTGKRFEER